MILKVINDKGNIEYISGEKITLPSKFVRAYLMDNNGKTIETINGDMESVAIKTLLDEIVQDNETEAIIQILFNSADIESIIDVYYEYDGDTIDRVLYHLEDKYLEEMIDHLMCDDKWIYRG